MHEDQVRWDHAPCQSQGTIIAARIVPRCCQWTSRIVRRILGDAGPDFSQICSRDRRDEKPAWCCSAHTVQRFLAASRSPAATIRAGQNGIAVPESTSPSPMATSWRSDSSSRSRRAWASSQSLRAWLITSLPDPYLPAAISAFIRAAKSPVKVIVTRS